MFVIGLYEAAQRRLKNTLELNDNVEEGQTGATWFVCFD